MQRTSEVGRNQLQSVQGFTLLELMVVLAILALISVVFPVLLNHALPGRRVAVTAERVRVLLRDAALEAMNRGVPIQVSLKAGSLQASAVGVAGPTLLEVLVPASVNVTLRGQGGQATATMTIYPDGSGDGAEVEMVARGHIWHVRRSPFTGRVTAEAGER